MGSINTRCTYINLRTPLFLQNVRQSHVSAYSLEGPTLVPLDELGVIAVTGADAVPFLQSQLTNDVARLGQDQLQLSGYCTPKGRLLATFHQWRAEDTVFLRAPRDVIASIVKRLSMFVMRAKAKVTDVSDEWTTHALMAPEARRC